MVTVVPDPNAPTPEQRANASREAFALLCRMAGEAATLSKILAVAGLPNPRRVDDVSHALVALARDLAAVEAQRSGGSE